MVEATQHATGLPPGKARALLGGFLFSGEDADKPLDGLSGGERRRLSLAVLVHSGANVLILDEPTNHLDLESREALEAALSQFPGSLLLVSHDRALLDAVGTRTIALEDRALHSYVGRLGRVPAGAGGADQGEGSASRVREFRVGWRWWRRLERRRCEHERRARPKRGKGAAGRRARPVASLRPVASRGRWPGCGRRGDRPARRRRPAQGRSRSRLRSRLRRRR